LSAIQARFSTTAAFTILCAVTTMVIAIESPTSARSGPHRRFARHGHHRHRPAEPPAEPTREEFDPPEITIGERLFLETRFSQFFGAYVTNGGDVNTPSVTGDPVVDDTVTPGNPLPGPFAGQSMNCRACHLVDEQLETPGGGMRTYGDFARRSPVPDRGDGKVTAPRNSPPLVNASLPRDIGLLLHFDGEFATMADLVKATFTGRNFGWLPRESNAAITNLARVIRQDNGEGELAQEFGGLSYRTILTGTDPSIPAEFRLPKAFRVNVARASDAQIFDAVAALVAVYTEHLEFSRDEDGHFTLSPFDVFLEQNDLPRAPAKGESDLAYGRRLMKRVRQLQASHSIQFVDSNPNTESGSFDFHDQPFQFGAEELRGMQIFFNEPDRTPLRPAQVSAGGIGNCVACHAAPNFTDFRFHNTGVTQVEYDGIHGPGKFATLAIPGLATRLAHHDAYLPATPAHPDASGRFRAIPQAGSPELTDLGLWNVFANPDFPKTQLRLWKIACDSAIGDATPPHLLATLSRCAPSQLLPETIALFKTPGLRDLNHSGPYMHNGQFDTLSDVVELYRTTSGLERASRLRNGANDLAGIALSPSDVGPVVSFLRSLNEDYN
jgi:hypothetical protein